MKSYENVRKDVQENILSIIKDAQKKLDELPKVDASPNDERDRRIYNELIAEQEVLLNNLDEVTTIEIAHEANRIIEYLYKLRGHSMQKYYEQFDETVLSPFTGIGPDNLLGVKSEDLQMFKGEDPNDDLAQAFLNRVNANFSSNVVLRKEYEQARDEFFAAKRHGEDEEDVNRKYVRYMESARDAGVLKQDFYHLLSTDAEYQQVKAAVDGMQK